MFKLYQCGCIGFVVQGMSSPKVIWIVKPCDGDALTDEYTLEYSKSRSASLEAKPSRKLTEEELTNLLNDLGDLIADGFQFRKLKSLLD